MQLATWPLLACAFVAPVSAAFLAVDSGRAAAAREARAWQASEAVAWQAVAAVEAEDREFWAGQLDATESELRTLARAANASAPVAKHAATGRKPDAVSQALTHMSLNPKSTADLIPALAMLKGLYEESKERIEAQNKREQKSKQFFADKEAEHNKRIARIESSFHNHTLNAEFHTNETRDETRLFTYWKNVRERQHHGFHTNLKIQHAMMSKVKTMIDMYEKTISGGGNGQEKVKKELQQQIAPEVVFVQVREFCTEALAEVQVQRRHLLARRRQS